MRISDWSSDVCSSDLEVEKQFEGYGKDAADKFLAEAGLTPDAARKVSHMIEHGVPEALLRDYAENSRRHLTVVGTPGGGMVYEPLIGSTARKIIDAVPGAVLLVPDPAKRKADYPPMPHSTVLIGVGSTGLLAHRK